MKIGMIHTLYGRRAGFELYVEKMIIGMVEKYQDISFVLYCNAEFLQTLEPHERIIPIYISHLDNQIKKAFWLEFLAKSIVDNAGIDVFWIPSGTSIFPGHWRAPNVVTIHDLGEYFIKGKYDTVRMFYRKKICIPLTLKRAHKLTAVSFTTARDLAKLFPKTKAADVIYSGSHPRKHLPLNRPPYEIIKEETGVDLLKILFTPGRTDFIGKGLDILLKAYQKTRQQVSNLPPLILVGPKGGNHKRFIAEIAHLGLENQVHWLGRVSDQCIDALYSISEMVIIASRFEGFGFPLLEAMEHRVPLVCSDAGSIKEVVGEGACIFESGNIDSLTCAMGKVHTDKKYVEELIFRGLKRLALFDWNRTFESMRRVFENTAKSSK